MIVRSLRLTSTLALILGSSSILLPACSSDDPPPTQVIDSNKENHAPKASAKASQTEAKVGTTITLDGSASTDADSDALTFSWAITSKPEASKATIGKGTDAKASFTLDAKGAYVFELTVTDAKKVAAKASVNVTAIDQGAVNTAPTASIKASALDAKVGQQVFLDGSDSKDPEGDAIAFAWKVSGPSGSKAALSDATAAKPSITFDQAGQYEFSLVVTDSKGANSAPSTLSIKVVAGNAIPTAAIEASAKEVKVDATVTFDGSKSTDPDNDKLSYQWTVTKQPQGSKAKLSDVKAAKPTLKPDMVGEYAVQLVVSDANGGVSTPASVTLTAVDGNVKPIGAIASVGEGKVGETIHLDASTSSDPDGDTLSYGWTFKSVPQGSAAKLSDEKAVKPAFTPDLAGDYVVELIVKDSHGAASDPVSKTVKVAVGNRAPVAIAKLSVNAVEITKAAVVRGEESTDPDGDALHYAWTLKSQPEQSKAAISAEDRVKASFSFVADIKGDYVFELVASDGKLTSQPSTVTLQAMPVGGVPPTAKIAAPQEAEINATIELDGSASVDPEGQPVTHQWSLVSKPRESKAALTETTKAIVPFVADVEGQYVFSLLVSDGNLQSEAASVVVSAIPQNARPEAVVRTNANEVEIGGKVQLDGSESKDPENATLTYAWTFRSRPDSSAAGFDDASSPRPTFTADREGSYVAVLVVSDGKKTSEAKEILISAKAANLAPNAVAKLSAKSIRLGATVALDGSGSSDPEHAALTFAWTITGAPVASKAQLANPTSAKATFAPDAIGVYTLSLVVSDGVKQSQAEVVSLKVTAANAAPTAVADISANEIELGSEIELNGAKSTDPENSPLTFQWKIKSAPAGSTAVLAAPKSAVTSFKPDARGHYVFDLKISDGELTDTKTVSLVVTSDNAAPTAEAIAAQSQVEVGQRVQLDGSRSSDPENEMITYAWQLKSSPTGSTATLDNPGAVRPAFVADKIGFYTIELVVSDGVKKSAPVTVTAEATSENRVPVVVARASSQEYEIGSMVQLDGSDSYDPENRPTTLAWRFVSTPAGSVAVLSDASARKPTFTADVRGNYVLELKVSDGQKEGTSTLTVRAVDANLAPIARIVPSASVVAVGAAVKLDASTSSDPENAVLQYKWSIVSRPQDSQAALSSAAAAKSAITVDVTGDYVVELVVSDGLKHSEPKRVTLTAKAQ